MCIIFVSACSTGIHKFDDSESCNRLSYFATVTNINRENATVSLRVMEVINGGKRGNEIKVKSMAQLRKSIIGEQYLLAGCAEAENYENIIPVYGIAPDRFKALQETLKEMSISFYTDNYATDNLLWIPASCNADRQQCQIEVNIIRNEYKVAESARIKGSDNLK